MNCTDVEQCPISPAFYSAAFSAMAKFQGERIIGLDAFSSVIWTRYCVNTLARAIAVQCKLTSTVFVIYVLTGFATSGITLEAAG